MGEMLPWIEEILRAADDRYSDPAEYDLLSRDDLIRLIADQNRVISIYSQTILEINKSHLQLQEQSRALNRYLVQTLDALKRLTGEEPDRN